MIRNRYNLNDDQNPKHLRLNGVQRDSRSLLYYQKSAAEPKTYFKGPTNTSKT